MLKSYFKKKFGKDKEVPEAEQFYSPLRIALHSTINIKTVDWIIMKDHLNEMLVFPTSNMTVLAIGETKSNDDTIYQFYLIDDAKEEFVLQLYCVDKAGKPTIEEATLFKQVVNIVPMSDADWQVNMEAIGWESLELDDNTYNRVWFENNRGQADLMEFKEKIVESNKTTWYDNSYMLYSREFTSMVGTQETEMLLAGIEETDETAEITMMLGLSVPLHNINIQ